MSPSYRGFVSSSLQASRTKSQNRKTNSQAELLLRRQLWSAGFRYRLFAPELPGRPDIVFRKARVAIFCDGDFWHGRNWPSRRKKLGQGANSEYWVLKIETNRVRDRRQTRQLRSQGWVVLRYWETDIRRDAKAIASLIGRVVAERLETR